LPLGAERPIIPGVIPRIGVLILLIVGAVALVTSVARPGSDMPAPPLLAPLVEEARHLAREKAGPAGLLGLRLVAAGCAPDGTTGALRFETGLSAARTYALVGFPRPSEVEQPGAVTVIVGLTEAEFDAEGRAQWLSNPCP
jgi:hypothetical protein